MKSTRQEVYAAIDSERNYQDLKWEDFDDSNNHPSDWILYIDEHISRAKKAIYNSHNMATFANEIRKIAALSVACMENHGVLYRNNPNELHK
jgi:hypothetical protein